MNNDYYKITLIHGFDLQELKITDETEAMETAERLMFFFKKQGVKISVTLQGITEGESQFNSDGEYTHSLEDQIEEIPL